MILNEFDEFKRIWCYKRVLENNQLSFGTGVWSKENWISEQNAVLWTSVLAQFQALELNFSQFWGFETQIFKNFVISGETIGS